ncbi:PAS domain S-box protein [Natrinema pallidum]|uniref:histidine kinase n=1 Tax=Natrinema pallidum TaxID=69527 RepID=A0A4V1IF98_9EURY|nr:PAS domain S-box protein [Natrinema pallidum]QCW04244.1 PAS domain S-box protein [Natrinema pallidum]
MGTTTGPTTRVVVVGDDAADVARALEEHGVSTESVRTVDACLERLPNVDGVVIAASARSDADPVDCCRMIRDRRSAVPIAVFPRDGSERLAGAVVAAGADGYVPRSQGVETLVDRLDALLEEPVPDACPAPANTLAIDAASSGDADSDRLESLIEQSPLAVIEWTLEYEVRTWNPAAADLFGYTAEEAIGESAVDLLVPDADRDTVLKLRERIADNEPDNGSFCRIDSNVRKDGTAITCEWLNTPLVDDDGEIGSVLSFVRDVTAERKRTNALEALQDTTRELLRAESTDEIADIVMTAAEDVIDRPLGAIRFYDDDSETLELAGTTSLLDINTAEIPPIGPDSATLWDAYTDSEPTVVENVSSDRLPYEIEIEVGNSLLQPLGDHGMLSVASVGSNELSDAEFHLIHVLATTAEAALDRAAHDRELERTKTVVETVGDCVYQLDRDGRFVEVNDGMKDKTGYERDELLGEHVSRILTDESAERGRQRVRELMADGEQRTATCEVTLTGADGERIPAEVSMALLRSDGDMEGTVGIARDISDRKRMERELVDRKAKIEGLHTVASRLEDCESREAIYDVAVEAAEDVLGFDRCFVDRICGRSIVTEAASSGLEIEHGEQRPFDEGIAGRTYRSRRASRVDETESDDGITARIDDCRSVLSVSIGDHGVFQAVSSEPDAFTAADEELTELLLSHVTDALDRIAFEERLRAERDRFAALFENVPDAVVSVSRLEDGPIVEDVNPAFERVFGYDEADLVGTSLDEVIVPPDRRAESDTLNRRGNRGEIGEAEVKRQTADGLRDFRLRVVPMEMDGSSDRGFGLYTDITAQKQRQKRLQILNRVLRHDLRNGMNIINGCAEMLVDAVDDADSEYVETIQNRTSELIGLAEKTRTVERVLDRETVAAGPVDLTEAVEGAVARLENTHPDVEVTCSLPDGAFARADEYLRAAVFQVLENAVEHNDRARPSVDVTVCDRPDKDELTLTVADDGPGIPPEERELLEGDREITQLRHASGLGLWLVNWVVTQAGGRLTFHDNEPRGTVVTLAIPRADAESVRSASDEPATGD